MVRAQSLGIRGRPDVRRAVAGEAGDAPGGLGGAAPAGDRARLPAGPRGRSSWWCSRGRPGSSRGCGRRPSAREPLAGLLARAGAPDQRVLRLYAVPESRLVAEIDGFDPGRLGAAARGHLRPRGRARGHRPRPPGGRLGGRRARGADRRAPGRRSSSAATARRSTTWWPRACSRPARPWPSPSRAPAGCLGARLTERPGSSAYVLGGLITYSNEAKTALLGVDPGLILRATGPSRPSAPRRWRSARAARSGSDWALSVTGVAGPGGGTAEKPVGLVFMGIAGPDGSAGARGATGAGATAPSIRERSVVGRAPPAAPGPRGGRRGVTSGVTETARTRHVAGEHVFDIRPTGAL